MAHSLSKSDFKLARQCITKLYYKKKHYLSSTDSDPFMELLAEGGYMVGKLAQILYPGEMIDSLDSAVIRTKELLKNENICVHEAAIQSGDKLIRIDILNKKGKSLELIEVKSKSWDSDNYKWTIKKVKKDFEEYLEDVAYQYYVLSEAFPEFTIKPYLFLPDKAKRTTIEGLNSLFSVRAFPPTTGGFRSIEIDFTGNMEQIREDDLMTLVDVSGPVLIIQDLIKNQSNRFLNTLTPELRKEQEQISIHCRDCEYRLSQKEGLLNGFAECWGGNAFLEHHVLDLTQLGNINRNRSNIINDFINGGKANLKELDAEIFEGMYHNRPFFQVITDKEIILPGLFEEINFKYPICFIDFEVSKMALPYHKGMRPYENVAFQWSCHTIDRNGKLSHQDWINTRDSFPNFAFAESLMQHIKEAGDVLIWSSYENTILKDIREQMDIYGYKNVNLKNWLDEFVRFYKGDNHGFIDQASIANRYYHHPLTNGKYGIKYILPAVLQETNSPMIKTWLRELNLLNQDSKGFICNPYDLLPTFEVAGAVMVKDGTGAIRAYQDMMYGLQKNDPAVKAQWEQALRQYCRLDTLAMVIIWEYWIREKISRKR